MSIRLNGCFSVIPHLSKQKVTVEQKSPSERKIRKKSAALSKLSKNAVDVEWERIACEDFSQIHPIYCLGTSLKKNQLNTSS